MFCIALVLVNSAGYYIYYKAETYKAKKQFKTKLRSIENLDELPNEVIRIAIRKSEKQLLKFKEKFEFELNGNLYDVIKSKVNGDSLIYYVLLDRDETQLFASFLKHISNEKKSESKNSKQNLSFEYLVFHLKSNIFIPTEIMHLVGYKPHNLKHVYQDIFHPPCNIS